MCQIYVVFLVACLTKVKDHMNVILQLHLGKISF